jgi:hypothetical protein
VGEVPRKEVSLTDHPMFSKFPENSTNRDYDIFEEFPDGSTIWRACVFGMGNVELKLHELAKETSNKFFALNLREGTQAPIRPMKFPLDRNLRRAS